MSQPTSRPINRIPQMVLLLAAATLIVFLVLLGTDTINPGGVPTMMIAGGLFLVGLVAMGAEMEINRTGFEKSSAPQPTDGSE